MLWLWLVNGLAGLVGMMLACETDGPPITKEHFDKLDETIETLKQLRNRVGIRDGHANQTHD